MLAKISCAIALFILCSCHLKAQYSNYAVPMQDIQGSSGINIYLGGNTFLGDLGGNRGDGAPFIKDFNSKTIRPFIGASYIYFPSAWLAVKAGLSYTSVTGADSLITEKIGHSTGRFDRNLSFKSPITEISAEAELYPLQTLWKYEDAGWRPFVGSGIGIFHFNPKTQLNGRWVALQPLHLEGQGFPEYPERKNYKLTQLYIPLTLGVKYRVNSNFLVSVSSTFRKTFTDYIDDVSTTYIDPSLFDKYLPPAKAALAKQLYYRPKDPQVYTTENYRGYGSKDSYTTVMFTLTYLFDRTGGYGFNQP